jgi:hypothetical protein
MRSARTKTLTGDLVEELIAQFLIKGWIAFKLPVQYEHLPQATSLNNQLIQKARQIEDTIRDMLDACVGQMFIAV